MKIKKESQAIIISLIVAIFGLVALYLGGKISSNAPENTLKGVSMYIIPIAYVLILKFTLFKDIKLNEKSFTLKDTVKYGWFMILVSIIFFVLNMMQIKNNKIVLNNVIFYLIYCIGTGIFEETMCRGIIQNTIVNNFKENNKSVFKGIIYSSFIFAILHFANLINQPTLILTTISQVVYAFSLGIMLGVIYYKTKSLILVISIHAFFNFLASFILVFPQVGDMKVQDITVMALLIQWILILPGIFIYYKKYKNN